MKAITNREKLLNELSLLETSLYRCKGLSEDGKYRHEPPKFIDRLLSIYSKLTDEDLKELLNIKRGL